MKKFSKKIIMAVSFIFLSGCTANVSVTFDQNKNIKEVTELGISKNYIINYTGSIDEAKLYYTELFNSLNTDKSYSLELDNDAINFKGTLKRNNLNIANVSMNDISKSLIDNISNNGNSYILTLNENLISLFTNDGEFVVDDDALLDTVVLKVKFYNSVISSNADSYNKFTNVYVWNITEDSVDQNIEFQLSNSVRYDIIYSMYLYIVFGIFVLIIIAFIFYMFYSKYKSVNKL